MEYDHYLKICYSTEENSGATALKPSAIKRATDAVGYVERGLQYIILVLGLREERWFSTCYGLIQVELGR